MKLKDADEMPFGKHKGERLGDVPANYLLWLGDQDLRRFPELKAYIDHNRRALEMDDREPSEYENALESYLSWRDD